MSSTAGIEADAGGAGGETGSGREPVRVLLARLTAAERAGFSAAQIAQLEAAAARAGRDRHPVNIRLTLPTLFSRYYLVVLGGRERRDSVRLAGERGRHPLLTRANLLFVLGAGALALYFSFVLLTLLGGMLFPPSG